MWSIITIVCGVYFGILLLMFLFQSKMIYFPTREIVCTPADLKLEFEDLALTTSDGVKINAWYVPAKTPRGTVIFCHGNGGNLCYSLDVVENFSRMNYNVMMFDYRGYGKSEGSTSEKGTYADAQACYDWLVKEKKIPEKEIVVMGRSLGGAIASNLAKDNSPRLLILESAFTSTADIAANAYPIFPVRLLCRFGYRNIENVKLIKCPLLVIHSPDDEIVPYSHGRKIFDAANDPKEFLQIRGFHNEGFEESKDVYVEGLKKFMEKY
ncbi:MAG: hypothetical protein A2X45_06730 [Lentisphaerae bacterium GWF2_50_93]|nr:MAG: hypothetical protein A2X45_06730 [Lentisphaerae bacterium GWF2_50_93]